MTDRAMHLTTEEIELWAQGLLPATQAMHLADCSLCRVEADRERKVILELVRLPQFAPRAAWAAGNDVVAESSRRADRRACLKRAPRRPGRIRRGHERWVPPRVARAKRRSARRTAGRTGCRCPERR